MLQGGRTAGAAGIQSRPAMPLANGSRLGPYEITLASNRMLLSPPPAAR